MSNYPAHIRINENGEKIVQTVEEHCLRVADLASSYLTANNKINKKNI